LGFIVKSGTWYNTPMTNVASKVLISKEDIQKRVDELARDLTSDYAGKNVVLLCVMRGSFVFTSDLIRALWTAGLTDCEPDFISVSSYGSGTESSKNPVITKDLDTDITNRHVVIVEDIVDTGYTVKTLLELLKSHNPASIKVLSLLSKPSRREVEVPIDYLGFEIENKWVFGYGLDISENKSRGVPEIHEKL
jgi:hypoxanthine phosphoribosyltransferase